MPLIEAACREQGDALNLLKEQAMYELAYMAYVAVNGVNLVKRERRVFETAEERGRYLNGLRECGCLHSVLWWSNPDSAEKIYP